MLHFEDSTIEYLIAHHVGNKHDNGNLILSKSAVAPMEEIHDILKTYFFKSFKEGIFYMFSGFEEKLENNLVYNCVKSIFDDENKLQEESVKLANFLFEQSYHPAIKEGELYVVLFRNCIIDDEVTDAIGIFKSENKDTFLKVRIKEDDLELSHDNGININKLDKGCLIFNTDASNGYKVCMVDISGKSKEANYWKDSFLQLNQRKDDYYQTQNYIDICKGFVKNVYNQNNGIEKTDQIDLLNKTSDYFQNKQEFNLSDFQEKVMENQDVIDAFRQYKDRVSDENELEIKDQFEISGPAVKRSKYQFKSVFKLDKNFHIYIHGDRTRIVKGFDNKTGLNYYQIFYETEI
jgi:hypothetical protein